MEGIMRAKGTVIFLIILSVAATAGQRAQKPTGDDASPQKPLSGGGGNLASPLGGIKPPLGISEHPTSQPLAFEVNKGQTDPQVKFLSRGRGSTLFLTGREAVIRLASIRPKETGHKPRTTDKGQQTNDVVRIRLQGSNPNVEVVGENELPSKSNYFIGNDPNQWRTNVPNYSEVCYRELYPGIDLLFYGNDRRLEFDFVVAPGADPSAIEFDVGAGLVPARGRPQGSPLRIDPSGDLIVETAAGELRLVKPVVYQPEDSRQLSVVSGQSEPPAEGGQLTTDNGPRTADNRQSSIENRKSVDGRYVLLAGNRVKFQLAGYDPTKRLVIDPSFWTHFVGTAGTDVGNAVAVVASSNNSPYIVGWTDSAAFPTTTGVYQPNSGGGKDVFVLYCIDICSNWWATYLGGSGDDLGNGIAVDASGNVYVTGSTTSGNFPVHGTPSPYQANSNGPQNAFVTVLNPTGSGLVYSTYLGGSGTDSGQAIATDGTGASYIVGTTTSTNLPATTGALQTSAGGGTCGGNPCHDAFFAKISSNGSALNYLTYLGGSGDDFGNGMALDSSSNIYLVGSTASSNLATSGAFQSTLAGTENAFLAKLSPVGSTPPSLLYLTYFGGSGTDLGNAIALDSLGNAYITGSTTSTNFPTTPGVFQTTLNGTQNAYVAKFKPTLSGAASLIYSTYLGGSVADSGNGIAVNGNGNAHVVGGTTSTNFPVYLPTQSANGGGEDAFATILDTSGAVLLFSTYLGGTQADVANGAALQSNGTLWFVGTTGSSNVFGGAYGGGPSDAFYGDYWNIVNPIAVLSPTSLTFPDTIKGATSSPLSVKVTNYGDTALSISSTAINGDFVIQTNGCGTSLAANSSCTISMVFEPSTTGARTGTLTISDNAANSSTQTVSLSGLGVSAGVVTFNPTSVTFAPQPALTTSAPTPVTLTNTGTGAMVITSIATSAPFAETNNCPITPAALAASTSCTINITFTPTAYGSAVGQITVTDDAAGSPQSVPLTGIGQAPVVSLSPGSLAFGSVAVGSSGTSQSVTLSNSGTLALNITNIVASAGFSEANNCPASLSIGASCTITVTFSPLSVGMISGTVTISDSALNSPQALTLSGTGTGVGVSLAPPNLTFNDQTVAVQSPGQQVTLANTGNAALTVSSISVSGLFPNDFSETDNCTSAPVAGPGSCTIKIFFTPSAAQSEAATLVITDNAPSSPQSVNLTGTGLAAATAPAQAYTMTRGNFGTGAVPSSLVGDDFNNDGRPDLVVANAASGNISVLLGAANGTFLPHIESGAGNQPTSVVGGDFNGDGNRDLAVTNFADNTVSILLGNGNGTFKPQVTYSTGKGPTWIAAGSFNDKSNSYTDLAIVNATDGTITILLGKGDGTFTAAPGSPISAGVSGPTALAVSDFNRDSHLDLAVTNAGNNTVSILLGQGDGTFSPASTAPATGADPVAVAVAAGGFTGNGWPDLVVANFKDNTLSVFLNAQNNPSAASFGKPTVLPTGAGPTSVKVGDFNGDGNLDIAVTYSNCGQMSLQTPCFAPGFVAIFYGNGKGAFLAPLQYAVGSGVAALAADNFLGNGLTDLVVANSTDNTVTVLMGQKQGVYTVRSDYQNGSVTNALAVVMADFNKDGIQDLAVADHDTNTVSIYLGNSDGTFKTPVTYATGTGPSALAVADFNRDGNPDLAVANTTNGTVSVLLGNGDGTFQTQKTTATGAGPLALVAGDFNNDGNPDLATANSLDNTLSILLGNGDGTFKAPATITVGANPDSVTAGDFNKDGNLDLAVANQGSNNLMVLLGKGNGTFQTPVTYATGTQPSSVTAADVSGDGILDLVETNAADSTVSVLIGNGDGTFKPRANYATATNPVSVAVGDFNGDNIVDLAVAAQVPGCANGAGDISVLLGAGGGQFHARMDYATASCPSGLASGTLGANSPGSVVASNSNGTVSPFQNWPVAALSKTSITFPQTEVGMVSAPVPVTLSNPSGAPLNLSSIVATGPFTVAPGCTVPGKLGVGFNCALVISFVPSASGAATGSVTISSNLQIGNWVITLTGTGETANLSLSPSSLSFGNQAVGVQSSPLTLTVTSIGTSSLTFNSVVVSGTNASDFPMSNSCSSVTSGNTCTVQVWFKPSVTSSETASLVLTDNGPNSPQSVPLTGTGVPAVPGAGVLPTSLTFSSQAVGTSSTSQSVTLTNTGTAALTIASIAVSAGSSDFSQTNNCPASTSSLAAGANCTISVTFKPTATGARTGAVTITDNAGGTAGSTQTVSLSGTGTANGPVVSLSAAPTFPSEPVGTASPAQTVTVTNTGISNLTFTAIATTGPFAIATSGTTCLTSTAVAAAGTCTVALTFTPTAVGAASGTLSFTDNAPNSPQTLSLSATGTGAVVSLSAAPTFPSEPVGTTSPAQTVTVTNTGNANLTFTAIGVTGPFAIATSGTTCATATSVAAAGTCAVALTFTPTAVGTATGILSLTDNATGSPQTLSLSGTGAGAAVSLSAAPTFPSEPVGTTSPAQTITVTNTGNVSVSFTAIGVTGPFAIATSGTTCSTTTAVAAAGTCTVSLTFTPTAVGAATGSLTFTDNAGNSPQSLSLSGTGTGAVVSLSAPPSFPSEPVGSTSAAQTVTVTNTGNINLTFTAIGVTGPFAIATSGTTCSTSTAVAAAGTCTVALTFTPTAVGAASGTLSFTDNAPSSPQTVSLTGTGTTAAPVASVSPSSLTFSAQMVSTTSAVQAVTVGNTGNVNLTISAIGATSPFAVASTGTTCATSTPVAASASCTINVTFTPTTSGAATGTLTVTDNSNGTAGSMQTVSLSGTGQDFSFAPPSGSPTSSTVAPGAAATYTLSVGGVSGFSGSVSFTCTGAPSEATCSVSPNPVTAGSTATNVTVTVTTTAASLGAPRGPLPPVPPPSPRVRGLWVLALALAAMGWGIRRRNQTGVSRWRFTMLRLSTGFLLLFALAVCGGGGGGGGTSPTPNPGTPAGTYNLTVTGTTGSGSSALSHSVTLTLTVS
jgi:hypothetical protein